ncbi:CotY/CotZ family spore coat protein [Metabacillus schmidteae]|uniref:CotY/CotZ family spore coat protein n=1 Tax=Metabacillus schmidteae TaxID=2730405 RepID=UPI00158B84A1|nr:CotY/CotZ family spore coat protein [Metabacillus schmidteae]
MTYETESNPNCVYEALQELKKQQDQLEGSTSCCYTSLLKKLLKVDTIPFMLLTNEGPFELGGFLYGKKNSHFHTSFFRIEKLDEDKKCVTLSLLRPITLYGTFAKEICDVERLERTKICVTVDTECLCAVQCLDIDLMKKVIVEPKW